jgi:tocopherol O-methyltransferase
MNLKEGIANFYDESSGLWEEVWGEHMHHGAFRLAQSLHVHAPYPRATGYYPKDGPRKSNSEAQIDMIDEVLSWAGVTDATSVSQAAAAACTRLSAPCQLCLLMDRLLKRPSLC